MKKSIKLGLAASALMLLSGVAFAQDVKLVDPRESPYVIDPRGVIVKDPFGLCWRTGSWSVERAAAAKIEGAKFRKL
jgi:OOP family OmpA-OmpF porin